MFALRTHHIWMQLYCFLFDAVLLTVHDPITSVSLPRNKRASENNTDRSWETIWFFFSSKVVRWPLSIKQLTSDFTNVTNSGIHNGARSTELTLPELYRYDTTRNMYSRDIGCRLFTSIKLSVQARRVVTLSISVFWVINAENATLQIKNRANTCAVRFLAWYSKVLLWKSCSAQHDF